MSYSVIIHGDGACSGNPGPGGWAAELEFENSIAVTLTGGDPQTTNNVMELSAVIAAFKYIVSNNITPADITLRLDSKYVLTGLETWSVNWEANNWKGGRNRLVKNAELWQTLVELKHEILDRGGSIDYVHVKGHSGDLKNELVDRIAVESRERSATAESTWTKDAEIDDRR